MTYRVNNLIFDLQETVLGCLPLVNTDNRVHISNGNIDSKVYFRTEKLWIQIYFYIHPLDILLWKCLTTSQVKITMCNICQWTWNHYIDVIIYSTVYSDADQRKHQSSASLAFVWGIHRDRWIPRTKGQLLGKIFHLMTSSCVIILNKHFLNPTAIKVKAWTSNYNPDKRTHVILIHPFPDCKVHGSNMGPIWGRQDPGGPHVGPMNFAIWVNLKLTMLLKRSQKYSIISTGLHTWQIRFWRFW